MNRAQFEHAVRAAGAILGADEILVIGSQAIHASMDNVFEAAQRSIEVDIASLDPGRQEAAADLIDGSIGELSLFQDTFGYYAQGVTIQTAVLPEGWEDRLVPFQTAATGNVIARCLEPHDLWIAKAIAGRTKDREFCTALAATALIQPAVLRERLQKVENLPKETRERVAASIG